MVLIFNPSTIALSGDTVAVVDKLDPSQIHVLDPQTSKNQGDGKISHSVRIIVFYPY